MSLIYYLAHYDVLENQEQQRNYTLAATTKISYIISAIEACGHTVEVISPCTTRSNRFQKGRTVPTGQRSSVRLFDTLPFRPRILRWIGRVITGFELRRYLNRRIRPSDTVIAYHSLTLMNTVRWLKKKKNCRLILETEEIYGDVSGDSQTATSELAYFKIADGYIVPAKRLNDLINAQQKPYTLIHGTYSVEEDRCCSFDDSKIHCVYAGTLDPRKGGAIMAANAVRFLPENYHLHILGFGTSRDVAETKSLVEELQKESKATITYDGCLSGEEYIRFLQSCHIGLSTQNPAAAFNDTSFPSKILTYMANGLQVVTVRIPVVEESAVDAYMNYYDEPTPQAIAQAIQAVDLRKSAVQTVKKLDQEFGEDIKDLLER